jgi:hypothetical protein
VDAVRRRLQRTSRRDRVSDRQGQRCARRQRGRDRKRERAGIGHARLTAQVARRRGEREPPLPRALLEPAQSLIDRDLAHHPGAGRHVSDPLGEQRRALLLEQRRGVPLHDGVVVALARRLAAIDLALDPAIADAERVARHRGVRGQREHVGDRERLGVVVGEALLEDDARDAALGGDAEGRALEREGRRAGDEPGCRGHVGSREVVHGRATGDPPGL